MFKVYRNVSVNLLFFIIFSPTEAGAFSGDFTISFIPAVQGVYPGFANWHYKSYSPGPYGREFQITGALVVSYGQ